MQKCLWLFFGWGKRLGIQLLTRPQTPSSAEQGSIPLLPCVPPGMLCPGPQRGWELAGAGLAVLPRWPKRCVPGRFERSLWRPQGREAPLRGESIPGEGRLGCWWAQTSCAVPGGQERA